MQRILGHFHLVGRKERRVLQLVMDHYDLVMQTVHQLESLLESARVGDWSKVEELAKRVAELETKADGIHRDAVVEISKGAFFSGTKEDFLSLMEENDEVADAAQNAARILSETPIDTHSFLILYEQPGATLNDLFAKLRTSVDTVQETLKCLETDAQAAVGKSLMVERRKRTLTRLRTS